MHYQLSFQILKKRQSQLKVVNKTQFELSTKQIYAINNFQQYDLNDNLNVNVSQLEWDKSHFLRYNSFYKINEVMDEQNV